MILSSTSKHREKIALCFTVLFVINMLQPLLAADFRGNHFIPTSNRYTGNFNGGLKKNQYGNKEMGTVDANPFLASKENETSFFEKLSEMDFNPEKPDIDGPGQPEMKSFQSVNADNMVDLFSGDFSYSIPLLDVGGYPVNLHYSSGITMDQEASWVGLGWNINPGTINRSMRGLPDDFDGTNDSITRTQHLKANKTTSVTVENSWEIKGLPMNISARLGLMYNNYNGYGLETGVGIGGYGKSSFGSLTGNLSISNNSQEGIRISPSLSATLSRKGNSDNLRGNLGISTGYSSRAGISSIQINGGVQSDRNNAVTALSTVLAPHATISFATPSYTPSVSMPITNTSYSFTLKAGVEFFANHPGFSFTGYANKQEIAPEDTTQKIPAIGYIYSAKGNNRENVLLDFNREKEAEFNYKTTPNIALPQYTYDAFSISGEGTGGSFRPYRGDVGYIFDHSIVSKNINNNGSFDGGGGALFHAGLEITRVTTTNTNHRWNQNSPIERKLRFQNADTTYEPVYFRNPGEKTTNAKSYYRAIGDDSLIRIKLGGNREAIRTENAFIKYNAGKPHAELPVNETLVKKERDKRTQVISYFTAEDATILALDKTIKSYAENKIPIGPCFDSIKTIPRVDGRIRKKNHLSEISVLNSDGRKYVYGLPIYNVEQKDVSFAVGNTGANEARGLVKYTPGFENSPKNTSGKDGFFSRDDMPAYAHNFLLTGIVSPDYVDITGNGISDDDPGDAVKFNYTQVYGVENDYYSWRIPFQQDSANYNEGFNTYNRDEKASYTYGRKEMWYLNSVESKSMVAVFRIANDRLDAYAVQGENGGLNTGKASRRLERIDLYVKADLVKNGTKARPVKSVHFSYNYELCKGSQGNASNGKLTLKSVWFTYNKNNKGKLNPYKFSYHPDVDGNPEAAYNPAFNSRHSDRWGTYKNSSDNPDGMSNNDYPYAIQDSIKAAKNASVWNLTDITLPSGGRMHVTYESDDYAFVQDKRATQFFTIAGINQSGQNKLYNYSSRDKEDYYTILINTADALTNKADIRNKYLGLDDVLYFKFAVNMPSDRFGSGTEMVPGYATIQDYGISSGNNHQFWVTVSPVEGRSPFSRAALQYLRLNLRGKAFPDSEGVDDLDLFALIKLLATSFTETKNMIMGFDDAAKSRNICNTVNLNRSFVRLSSPNYKKLGGGYRVKRVEIFDNWKKMTTQRESTYGQEYTYTKTESVDGKPITISSGVATYEPAIGAEENPFRRPISYKEKTAPMGPVNYMFSEEPIGETFFASPMIGYSKVRVRTINAKAKSANGWEETEFFTSRDFPTIVEHTLLEEGSSKFKYETKSNFLRLNHKSFATLSQGFRIELNDMNGKMKAQSTYSEVDPINPIKYSLNFYKVDDDKVLKKHLNNNVWVVDSISGHIDTTGQIGKDIEIMADLREQNSKALTSGFSPNIDAITPFLPFLPVLWLPSKVNLPQKEETRFRSAAIVKIVQRYGILDSVVVMDKGSVVSTKNILYDGETGNVLLSRTNNEFNDPIYNFNYPAYWAYSGMDLAYKNIGAVFQTKTTSGFQLNAGRLFKEGSTEAFPANRFFESGDEVYVYSAAKAVAGSDCRYLNYEGTPWTGRLWVIESGKGINKDNGLYFIDSLGRVAPDMIINKMVITRSGKRNMPDASGGSVVMMNSPLKLMPNGQYRIVIDSNTRVLNASASSFKDGWKVENTEYQYDSCYTIYKQVYGEVFYPTSPAAVFRDIFIRKDHVAPVPGNLYADNFVASSYKRNLGNRNNHIRYNLKSVIQFDLANRIKKGATITNAQLYLQGSAPRLVWQGVGDSRLDIFPQKTKAHFMNGDLNGTTNASNIRQVIGSWNINTTHFNNLLTGSTSVAVGQSADQSCDNKAVNVTAFAVNMLNNPGSNYGLVINLNDLTTGGGEDNTSERTLSFCTSIPYSKGIEQFAVPTGCINCTTPSYMTVDYSYQKDTCVKVCRKNIVDSATNPYRWGILGNWRMDRAYTYYNSRQESDATIKMTNIRQEGLLKNFMPYWSFTSTGLAPSQDSSRWVWNSAISLFNRKGFEIENYDALGRYNSGLYGYNQTLPVAVAQNSRYREIMFDGFEDYGYKSNYCATCPPKREFDFLKGNTGVDTTQLQSHSGLYSLKVNNGYEALLTVPVSNPENQPDSLLYSDLDSSSVTSTQVVGAGQGLIGNYRMGVRIGGRYCTPGLIPTTRTDTAIAFDWTNTPPLPPQTSGCDQSYSVSWQGSVQPRYSDYYQFHFRHNGTATIRVNDQEIYNSGFTPQTGEVTTGYIYLQAGQVYAIEITYTKGLTVPAGPIALSWSSFIHQAKEIVPKRFLYPAAPLSANTAGSISQQVLYYCVKGRNVRPKTLIRPVFSPIKNTRITVSAWVRLDVTDCNVTPALDSAIQVQFDAGINSTVWLKKTGLRIEGWQRYEANVDVPAAASAMYLRLKTLSSNGIFVDDIRVQPFNSGMKGFVYNPVNLRLMAELDENNYASFYEYDDDGTLIRVKKETERGIMTIRETRSALFKD